MRALRSCVSSLTLLYLEDDLSGSVDDSSGKDPDVWRPSPLRPRGELGSDPPSPPRPPPSPTRSSSNVLFNDFSGCLVSQEGALGTVDCCLNLERFLKAFIDFHLPDASIPANDNNCEPTALQACRPGGCPCHSHLFSLVRLSIYYVLKVYCKG